MRGPSRISGIGHSSGHVITCLVGDNNLRA